MLVLGIIVVLVIRPRIVDACFFFCTSSIKFSGDWGNKVKRSREKAEARAERTVSRQFKVSTRRVEQLSMGGWADIWNVCYIR